jgi:cytochrome c
VTIDSVGIFPPACLAQDPISYSITDEETQQVVAFINSKPRPAYPFKQQDYLTEKLPADSVDYPRREAPVLVERSSQCVAKCRANLQVCRCGQA